jgi:hypothetical protein
MKIEQQPSSYIHIEIKIVIKNLNIKVRETKMSKSLA